MKLKDPHTGNTLCAKGSEHLLPNIESSEPLIRVAITAKQKGGEDRLVTGLHALAEEDPSSSFRFDGDIRQSILAAQGERHMESLYKRLRESYGVEVETEVPRILYREPIRVPWKGSHRHRKQSGGRGQFAEVQLKVAPKTRGEGFEFLNNTVGASIPRNFIPAVEKGLREDLTEGPLLVVSSHRPLCKCFRRKTCRGLGRGFLQDLRFTGIQRRLPQGKIRSLGTHLSFDDYGSGRIHG